MISHDISDIKVLRMATVLVYIAAQFSRGLPYARGIREKWQKLCEQAAVEKDPETLLELTMEINRLLHEKEVRLKREPETRS